MLLDTKGVVISTEKQFRGAARDHRKRWGNEMKFRLGKSRITRYDPSFIVIPITKYSPLFDIFNPMILRMQETGIIEQLAKFYYLDYFEDKEERELEPIQLGHMMTGVYALIIGLVLAAVSFSLEKIMKKHIHCTCTEHTKTWLINAYFKTIYYILGGISSIIPTTDGQIN